MSLNAHRPSKLTLSELGMRDAMMQGEEELFDTAPKPPHSISLQTMAQNYHELFNILLQIVSHGISRRQGNAKCVISLDRLTRQDEAFIAPYLASFGLQLHCASIAERQQQNTTGGIDQHVLVFPDKDGNQLAVWFSLLPLSPTMCGMQQRMRWK